MKTIFLSDPDKKAPFPIVLEGSDNRYLTGADFDVESIQPVADGFWIGEEFGPYLLKFDLEGRLTDVDRHRGRRQAGHVARQSDADAAGQSVAAKMPAFNLKRSGGFEGLAHVEGRQQALRPARRRAVQDDGERSNRSMASPALRIIEFDVATKAWTGRSWLYPLAEGGDAIGDFNMLDETTALVIERDNGAGTADKACADPKHAEAGLLCRRRRRSSASTRSR